MEERPSIPQPDTPLKTESAASRGTSPSGFSLLTFFLSTATSLHFMIASFETLIDSLKKSIDDLTPNSEIGRRSYPCVGFSRGFF